jgi:hypothetical protein
MVMSETKTSNKPQIFNPKEFSVLQAALECMVPKARHREKIDLALRVDEALREVRSQLARELKLLLVVLEYGPPVLGFRFKRFSHMTPQEQSEYLGSWERSFLPIKRMGFQALKRAALAAFYGAEASWSRVGYRGPWLDRGYPHDFEGKSIEVPD